MSNISVHSVEDIVKSNPIIQKTLQKLQNLPELRNDIKQKIERIICIFQQYDKIQLLGGLSLRHLPKISLNEDHIPMLNDLYSEAQRMCSFSSAGFGLDPTPQDIMTKLLNQLGFDVPNAEVDFLQKEEDGNIILEYALSFSSAVRKNGFLSPSYDVISELHDLLKETKDEIVILEMERDDSHEEHSIRFFSHVTTIGIRCDGYPPFIEDVFMGLFGPHDDFFKEKFGFTSGEVLDLVMDLDKRIYSKINNGLGHFLLWKRFRKWYDDLQNGITYIVDSSIKKDSFLGNFFQCNPDLIPTGDSKFGVYDATNFSASSMIFWIPPNSSAEEKILSTFSHQTGDNSSFIQDGEFKGFITNESLIYTRPFIQENNRFYCFSHYLPYVQLFEMMEYLLKQDRNYYNQKYQQNNEPCARDNYFEDKVKCVFEKFLPHATFYCSTHYNISFEKCPKEPELDVLGISSSATYIIEVKAHELSHKDKIRIKGLLDKVKDSVNNALHQCERSKRHILEEDGIFKAKGGEKLTIDKVKPIYKIVVTFQQLTMYLTDYESYQKLGILDSNINDSFVISLFDLMAILDNMKDENELIQYLEIHKEIFKNKIQYCDELDLFNHFKEGSLTEAVKNKGAFIAPIQPSKLDQKYHCNSICLS